MAKYLREFANNAEYETYINGNPDLPNVSLIDEDDSVKYYNTIDYSKQYLTFVALEDGTFSYALKGWNNTYYSLDEGDNWTQLASNTSTPTVHTGEKIMWKGNVSPSHDGSITFSSTGQYEVEGNVMCILYMDDFKNKTILSCNNCPFKSLFASNTGLTSAEHLSLPATTLNQYGRSYQSMFEGCTSLITAPELPATTLTYGCYSNMFKGCTSLTSAPELPATTLTYSCYSNMFEGCTSLTTAPELPATTLVKSCYEGMFYNCTSLTTAPELPATALTNSCYFYMFYGCTSLTTAPELPATVLADSCYYQMFYNCTSLTTAPELPATTLEYGCYYQMFYNCSSLNYIKMLAQDIIAYQCLDGWVSGVSATGTFVKASSATLPTGNNGIPSGWEVINA